MTLIEDTLKRSGGNRVELSIGGMTCASCLAHREAFSSAFVAPNGLRLRRFKLWTRMNPIRTIIT